MKRLGAVLILLWMVGWAGLAVYGAVANVPVVQGVAGGTMLPVDGSGVTQPVSGTFWQATQPISGTVTANQGGTWTVQPGNTANTTAWKVDNSAVTQPVSGTFWQATQPVSAASLPLPTGASTSAKQPALGTAGAASADVLSVQGIASMTALKVDGSAVTQPVSGTVTANIANGVNTSVTILASAARTTTQNTPDQTSNAGRKLVLIVNVSNAGTGSITPSLQIKDSISGNYFTVWTAATPLTTNGTYAYLFATGASGGTFTENCDIGVPSTTYRWTVTANNANSVTYSVSNEVLL